MRIGIIGTGLIGGSLGLVWRKRISDVEIVGFDEPRVMEIARERGAIDRGAATSEAAVDEADVVVLATPIASILTLLERIGPGLKQGALVTDVGSVKRPVHDQAADVLPASATFIGGHPMAGSERRGIEHADDLLFENATYVVCPPGDTDSERFSETYPEFVSLLQATGARLILLSADRHDEIAATVSHLPQLLAVSLTRYAASRNQDDEAFLQLAAGGFRDMTRIASSPFDVWRDILVANHGPILDVLAGFASQIQSVRHQLAAEDLDGLSDLFEGARATRETIPRDTKGFLHPLADVYVYAEDRPGELLSITRTLHESDLNIKDIELLKIREGTGGAFRIGFSSPAVADQAAQALTDAGYTAYRL